MQVIKKSLLAIFSVIPSQKILFMVATISSPWSYEALLPIHPLINPIFLKGIGQNLTTNNILDYVDID